jgi:hypothetical protein
MDLAYILLKRSIDELNNSGKLKKPLIIDYFRNKKALRVENASYLLLKEVTDNQDWLNIGATYTILDSNCVIDFITSSISDYNIVKEVVRKTFKGQNFVYYPKDTSDLVLSYSVENVGMFLRKVNDVDNVVSENIFVELSDGSLGWVVYKDVNNDCYIFLGTGQFMMPIINSMNDLSDTLKRQYRIVFNISMKVIKR